jgi:hypothetical protein
METKLQKDLLDLELNIINMIKSFRLLFKKGSAIIGVSNLYIIEDFGLIICGVTDNDYTITSSAITKNYKDWHVVYIFPNSKFTEKKDEVLWHLMSSGYMTYIRRDFPRQFKELITMNNLGRKIIEQRLKVFADKPKYKWQIAENLAAKKESPGYLVTVDPGFFDYMPET